MKIERRKTLCLYSNGNYVGAFGSYDEIEKEFGDREFRYAAFGADPAPLLSDLNAGNYTVIESYSLSFSHGEPARQDVPDVMDSVKFDRDGDAYLVSGEEIEYVGNLPCDVRSGYRLTCANFGGDGKPDGTFQRFRYDEILEKYGECFSAGPGKFAAFSPEAAVKSGCGCEIVGRVR